MINKSEIIRYLGYGKNTPDTSVIQLIDECITEVSGTARKRNIYRIFDLIVTDDDYILAAGLKMHSRNLSKNLRGCEKIIFFAATLGIEVDRLLSKNLKLNMTKAAIIQATAAACIEDYCNECQKEIEEKEAAEGYFVRPRFSPGYGDLELGIQKDFLAVINATKQIGITLSDGGIMIPEKSVSAVMGLSRVNSRCHIEGCEVCEKTDCNFRRGDL